MNALVAESGAEILKTVRAPEFIVPTLMIPMVFYALFGILIADSNKNAVYLLATYGIFAVMGPSIFGFGVSVANERDRGWLQIKRASPSHAINYICAKVITTVLFATLALMPVYLIAGLFGDVTLTRSTWILLYISHILAVLPFILIGLSLGFSFGSNGTVAISNIVFLGLSIFGGLWFPVSIFPNLMQKLATFTPSYHLSQLSLAVVNPLNGHDSYLNFAVALLMTALFAAISYITWARQ